MYIYKETVLSALKLLQYFQLPNKNSSDISRYNYNCFRYFKIIMYLFLFFSVRTPNGVLWYPEFPRNPV